MRRLFVCKFATGSFCIALAGCGNLNTAYRSESSDGIKAISVDAKQRFAFIKTDAAKNTAIVCPEPSPDAISAGGVSISIDASKASVADLKAALGTAEQAASLGLRTQSIQLLRDQLAYLCLLRMADPEGGGVNAKEYLTLFKRYQVATLGVLAIEQLTGTVKSPPVTVSASGSAAINVGAPSPAASSTSAAASQPDTGASAPEKSEGPGGGTSKATAKSSTGVVTKRAVANKVGTKTGPTTTPADADQPAKPPSGSASPSIDGGGSQISDVQIIASKVLDIVRLVVKDAFEAENCQAAYTDPAPKPNIIDACVLRAFNSCVSQGGKPEQCTAQATREATQATVAAQAANAEAKARLDVASGSVAPENAAAYTEKAKATAAETARTQFTFDVAKRLRLPIPLSAFDYGIFRCRNTDQSYANGAIGALITAGVGIDKINDRGSFSETDLASKGFKNLGAKPIAEVLYDADEQSAGLELVRLIQAVMNANPKGGNAIGNLNPTAATPRYLSVAICAP